jgi:hypothetical protein
VLLIQANEGYLNDRAYETGFGLDNKTLYLGASMMLEVPISQKLKLALAVHIPVKA